MVKTIVHTRILIKIEKLYVLKPLKELMKRQFTNARKKHLHHSIHHERKIVIN